MRHQLCIDGTIYCHCTARAVGDDSKAHAVVAICRPARSPPYRLARSAGRSICARGSQNRLGKYYQYHR